MLLIIDDRKIAATPVSNLVGRRRFGDVLYKRRPLADWLRTSALANGFDQVMHARTDDELHRALADACTTSRSAMLMPASVWMETGEPARSLMQRLALGGVDARLSIGRTRALFSASGTTLSTLVDASDPHPLVELDESAALVDLDDYRQCLAVLSDAFQARHFNALRADTLEVVKRSTDRDKIRAEHDFWHLLPDGMKRWFVMPYGFEADAEGASYRMERLHVADLALQWVHAAISPDEFDDVLALLTEFLGSRPTRAVSREGHATMYDALYIDKVNSRMEALRGHPDASRLQHWLSAGTRYADFDAILAHYFDLRQRIQAMLPPPAALEAIVHGDLCFSNILYERHARLLKLIDPKGAASAEALWGEPGYDWAKLSHSVLGDYDFINHGQYRLDIDADQQLRVTILSHDREQRECRQRFVAWLQEHGQHPLRVRIDEASLFLSMLPLHLDQPHKVLALLVNAADILNDIESNLRPPADDHH